MIRIKILQYLFIWGLVVNPISCLKLFPNLPIGFPFFPHFWEFSSSLTRPSKIDHFVFALSWPATPIWALNDAEPTPDASWVIHGLWPEVRGKERPSPMYCSERYPFTKAEIVSIENELKRFWPGSDGRTAEEVWRLVWGQFGTCSMGSPNIQSEFDYFNASLHLYNKFPVQKWLAEQGIVPDPSNTLRKSEIINALVCGTGKRPYLRCTTEHHQQYLQSIIICVDLDLNPIDCTHWNAESHEYLCGSRGIIYPDVKPRHDDN